MTTPFLAFTRDVAPSMVDCELTHLARTPIDVTRARYQHAGYERLLATLGCTVRRIAPAPAFPDSVFIEDTAVVFDEVAVVTRPGADSRRGEVPAVEAALAEVRPVVRITAPATLDGGDVLVVGRRVFIGQTARTNAEGIAQLGALLAPHGYMVEGVTVTGCLHLKTAATAVDDATVLCNPDWVDPAAFTPLRTIAVHPDEPMGANVLRIGNQLLYDEAYPRTRARLEDHGYTPHLVDASELAKAEGAVTCCSLILRTLAPPIGR